MENIESTTELFPEETPEEAAENAREASEASADQPFEMVEESLEGSPPDDDELWGPEKSIGSQVVDNITAAHAEDEMHAPAVQEKRAPPDDAAEAWQAQQMVNSFTDTARKFLAGLEENGLPDEQYDPGGAASLQLSVEGLNQRAKQAFQATVSTFTKAQPDYGVAIAFGIESRAAQLREANPGAPESQIQQKVKEEINDEAGAAMVSGKNPAAHLYQLAKERGYGSAGRKLDTLSRGQAASLALGKSGAGAGGPLTAESLHRVKDGDAFDRGYAVLLERQSGVGGLFG